MSSINRNARRLLILLSSCTEDDSVLAKIVKEDIRQSEQYHLLLDHNNYEFITSNAIALRNQIENPANSSFDHITTVDLYASWERITTAASALLEMQTQSKRAIAESDINGIHILHQDDSNALVNLARHVLYSKILFASPAEIQDVRNIGSPNLNSILDIAQFIKNISAIASNSITSFKAGSNPANITNIAIENCFSIFDGNVHNELPGASASINLRSNDAPIEAISKLVRGNAQFCIPQTTFINFRSRVDQLKRQRRVLLRVFFASLAALILVGYIYPKIKQKRIDSQIALSTSSYDKTGNAEEFNKIPPLLGIDYGFSFVSFGDFSESMSRNNIFIHGKLKSGTPLVILSGQESKYCAATTGQSKKSNNPVGGDFDITQVQLVNACSGVITGSNNKVAKKWFRNLLPDIPIALVGATSVDYKLLSLNEPLLGDKGKISELEDLIAKNTKIQFSTFDPKTGGSTNNRPPLEKILKVKHKNKNLYFMFYKGFEGNDTYSTTIIMVNNDESYPFYPGCHGGIYLFELDSKLYISYFYAGCDNGGRGKELYIIYDGKPMLLYRNRDFAT